jgi:hypothetical protein
MLKPIIEKINKPDINNAAFRQALFIIYALLFLYFYFFQMANAWHFTIDDTYITLRYARHLISHHGLVWNVGGPHIEGYSNFSYLLLGAVSLYFQLPAVLVSKVISSIAIAFSVFGLYLLSSLWLPKRYCLLSGLILLMHPGEIIWGVSGLETPFFQCLVIFSTFFLLQSNGSNTIKPSAYELKQITLSGLLLALASLTRPEGPMLFLCFGCLLFFIEKSWCSKRLTRFILSFSLLYAPYYLWRTCYFGRLFPNTVYCKAMNAPAVPWMLDISYLQLIAPFLLIIMIYLKNNHEKRHLFLLLPSVCYLLALYNADSVVGFHDRHFLLAYALLLPLFILGMRTLFEYPALRFGKKTQTALIVFFSLLMGFLFTTEHYSLRTYRQEVFGNQQYDALRKKVAVWLKANQKPNSFVSISDCGVIPYYYPGNVIDSYCLNNLAITKKPLNYDYDKFSSWLLNIKKPAAIILVNYFYGTKTHFPPPDHAILSNPSFYQQYRPVKQFSIDIHQKGLQYIVYYRNSTPIKNNLPIKSS